MDICADHYRVEIARDRHGLDRYRNAWSRLAANAADPNVFFEPESLLPAIEAFGAEKESWFLFVLRDSATSGGVEAVGFFPMELRTRFRGVPLRHLAAWTHPQLFLATPLVHRDYAEVAWRLFLTWAGGSPQGKLLEWPMMLGDGETRRALQHVLQCERTPVIVLDRFERALLVRGTTTGVEFQEHVGSPGARREWRRQRRRLAEEGKLEVRAIQPGEDVEPWLDQFLAVETSGWKGREGTSLASNAHEERYFRTMCASVHAGGGLHMLGMFLDGVPIAIQCNVFTDGGAFALKVAFDERYRKYSPGSLLELENIADVFGRDRFIWMDSCTKAGHPLMHRLWPDRRSIEHILIAPGMIAGNVFLSLFAAARHLKQQLVQVTRRRQGREQNRKFGPGAATSSMAPDA